MDYFFIILLVQQENQRCSSCPGSDGTAIIKRRKWVLDLKDEDIFWCTADPGWVTGTAYGIFGPWLPEQQSLVLGGQIFTRCLV